MYSMFLGTEQCPVTPSKITTKIKGRNETITLMNDGEVNILKTAGLTDFEFELLIPQVQHPFAFYPNGFKSAAHYLDHLEKLKQSLKPFTFIVNRSLPTGKLLFDTNMLVSLENYEIVEDAENGFDIKVSVVLKQYKPFGNKRLKIEPKINTPIQSVASVSIEKPRDTTTYTPPKTHTVVKGDTLSAIAKKYLGAANRHPELAKLNNIANPNLIYPGQVLRLE